MRLGRRELLLGAMAGLGLALGARRLPKAPPRPAEPPYSIHALINEYDLGPNVSWEPVELLLHPPIDPTLSTRWVALQRSYRERWR